MKYHIGCGGRDWGKEWQHVDGRNFPHVVSNDVFLNDVPAGSVHEIYASHFIEYFDRIDVINLLKAWKRALRDRGLLRIAVPDFEAIAGLYYKKEFELHTFLGMLYGCMGFNGEFIYHKTTYDLKSLSKVLADSGFGYITRHGKWDIPTDDCSHAFLPHMNFETGTLMSLNISCVSL